MDFGFICFIFHFNRKTMENLFLSSINKCAGFVWCFRHTVCFICTMYTVHITHSLISHFHFCRKFDTHLFTVKWNLFSLTDCLQKLKPLQTKNSHIEFATYFENRVNNLCECCRLHCEKHIGIHPKMWDDQSRGSWIVDGFSKVTCAWRSLSECESDWM